MNTTSFNIYDASAGSGKTYTLVKAYLKICFSSSYKEPYKRILAMTFTNKAVAEMKNRILETLKQFSQETILTSDDPMCLDLCNDLEISRQTLHLKSKALLSSIAHNYAAFDISTIDRFTQKLIRTFAFDLKIPINFQVELDTDSLLRKAVDNLIAKAGTNKALTTLLVDFAIEKADDDKSWDLSLDFNKIAKLLVNENDTAYVNALKSKTLDDFKGLKVLLKQRIIAVENQAVKTAKTTLSTINNQGLQHNDFTRSYLPKYFENLADKKFNVTFGLTWQTNLLEGNALYPKRVSDDTALTIQSIQPQLASSFETTRALVFDYKFLKAFYKNITPLSVLNAINNELNSIKQDTDVLLISEFNTLISTQIKDQPAAFIYERIGEKFKHYFIDEFQDTSVLQWENLIPLLENSLSEEKNSITLVGDAKQSIYRWRGGKAEQFIALCAGNTPFFISPEKKQLPINYRSYAQIVNFNNTFFKHLSSFVFSDHTHKTLYAESSQAIKKENNGYVNISFLDKSTDDDIYEQTILKTISNCISNGFDYSDICILVRKKKDGITIANYLTQQAGIPIISSETLLISNSAEVNFIVNILKFTLKPKDNELKVLLLKYLANHKLDIADKHHFYSKCITLDIEAFFEHFKRFDFYFNYSNIAHMPIYEAVETIIQSFNLVSSSDAYVQFFLDYVFDYSQKHLVSILDFIETFESKKDRLSIVSPEGKNAVQIMTIHKSKGLEFPVVIFPYADLPIYFEREPKAWFPIDKNSYHGFSYAFLDYSKTFEDYGNTGLTIYKKRQAELELDTINLLYVTLTRAIEQLYIMTKAPSKEDDLKSCSGLFVSYLKTIGEWDSQKVSFSFGTPQKKSKTKKGSDTVISQTDFISTSKESHYIKIITNPTNLWDQNRKEAIEKGHLIHDIMSKIKFYTDVDNVFSTLLNSNTIHTEQLKTLKDTVINMTTHKLLKPYFANTNTVYNEKEILTKNGMRIRPDRVVVNQANEAVIIDYKTGLENPKYNEQLQTYQNALEDMGFVVLKKILVYINKVLDIKEV